ncbi:hypothetical protein RUND412_004264 [Rhizina undulata]
MRFSTAILSVLPLASLSLAGVLPAKATAARDVCPLLNEAFKVHYVDGRDGGLLDIVLCIVDDVAKLIDIALLDLFWDESSKRIWYEHRDGSKHWGYFVNGLLTFGAEAPAGCDYWTFDCSSYDGFLYPSSGYQTPWSAYQTGNNYQLCDSDYAPAPGSSLLSIKLSINID